MGAVWQIVTSGSESQQRAAIDVLVETRRKLYGILADGDDAERRGRRTRRRVMTDQTIRLSDAEREAAAADLGEHFAQGRLTADEHAERLEQVWAAKTRGEVAPIFRDLPSPYAAVASARRSHVTDRYWNAGLRPFRRGVPAPLLVVLAVLIVLSAIAHFPFFLLGFAVFWFVVLRHRGPAPCVGPRQELAALRDSP